LDATTQLSAPATRPLGEAYPFPVKVGEHPLMPGAEPFLYEAGPVGCLLVHGFTSTPYEMRALGHYLVERGITAGAQLLAGHGTSPEDLQHKTWHDWYASVSDALDVMLARCERVYLAGLSLGGALTLYTAARRGGDLAGIVAMAAPIYVPPGVGTVLKGLQSTMPFLNKPYRDIEDPEALSEHISYAQSPSAATASLIEFVGETRGVLGQVTVPTLVMYARRDHVVPGLNSHHIYSRLASRDKRLLALHRGFHIMTVDTDRDKVREAIYSFIVEHEEENETRNEKRD
jgi:carboxylesterase